MPTGSIQHGASHIKEKGALRYEHGNILPIEALEDSTDVGPTLYSATDTLLAKLLDVA